MSAPRMIIIGSIALFTLIGITSLVKGKGSQQIKDSEVVILEDKNVLQEEKDSAHFSSYFKAVQDDLASQEEDQIWRLFTKGKKQFPLVETIRYKSRVNWMKGRPVWIGEYATHYGTSCHFIARSLNGKEDYTIPKITSQEQFNVLKEGVSFHCLIDLSRCKMWFYAYDEKVGDRFLLKTYKVGLGRFDSNTNSGLLTPKGKYLLGDKVAIYKPKVQGFFQKEEVEMVQVFGSRWIPFVEEISGEGDHPKGYGLHGAPWVYDENTDTYKENLEGIGQYDSDGCIRLAQKDIEEIYSIVITRPTVVEIVTDFKEANLPGREVEG